MNFNYITVVIIILLCTVSTYTDLLYGKVRNKYLIAIGVPAVISNLYCHYLFHEIPLKGYIFNILICLMISLGLYLMKIWAGGDCKLFAVIVLAAPGGLIARPFYDISFIIWMPFLAFMIAYVYILVDSVILWSRQEHKNRDFIKKIIPSFAEYFKSYLAIVFIDYFASGLITFFSLGYYSYWMLIAVNVLLLSVIHRLKLLQYRSVMITLALADVILGFYGGTVLVNRQILIVWLMVILSNMMRIFAEEYNYKEIEINQLKKGMILSTASSMLIANGQGSRYDTLSDESLGSRLSEEDIKDIQQWHSKKKLFTSVTIVRKIPFAAFISIAAVMVMMAGIFF